jgi:DNA-binding beta-propeller fold protein YncE
VVANIGRGQGDSDTVSVIDLQAQPFRVVETVVVGQTPEGIALSPDGKLCAVVVMNGSVDRALVAGHRLLGGQPDDPGAEHGGEGDLCAAVGRVDASG